jgi:hypothetical protein
MAALTLGMAFLRDTRPHVAKRAFIEFGSTAAFVFASIDTQFCLDSIVSQSLKNASL